MSDRPPTGRRGAGDDLAIQLDRKEHRTMTTRTADVRTMPARARRNVHPLVALTVIAGAQLMVVLDVTIVNVALPNIQTGLGFSRTGLAWVIDAYTLAFGGLLLLGGRAGDILGRRRMFMTGVALFAGASLLGGFAVNEAWLIASRALQGVGAAIAAPSGLALLTTTFPEGRERNRAFGVFAAVAGAGGGIGLILGGVLTDFLSWRWVLFVNVPIGVALVLAAPYVLSESARNRKQFDLRGAITVTAGVGSLVYGFINAATAGWGDTATMLSFAVALVLLTAFLIVEMRSRQPLLPLHLFANRNRWGSYLVMLMIGASLFGVLFYLTQYMQNILGFSPLKTGLLYLPMNLTLITVAQVASRLVRRTGPRVLILSGTALVGGGLLLMSAITVDSGYALVLPALELVGAGLGLVFVPITLTAVSNVDRRDSGVASAMLNVSQQVGGTLGLSALVTVAATATASQLAGHASATGSRVIPRDVMNQALVQGWAVGFRYATVFAAIAFLAALVVLRPAKRGELNAGTAAESGEVTHIGNEPQERQPIEVAG
jgi:EmrB/QacA subfamily drug resistance transporter